MILFVITVQSQDLAKILEDESEEDITDSNEDSDYVPGESGRGKRTIKDYFNIQPANKRKRTSTNKIIIGESDSEHLNPNVDASESEASLPSSAPVQRLFSFASCINSPRRNALSDELFEKLVLMKANCQYEVSN